MSGLAEAERESIMRHANGRKPKLDAHQQAEARKRLKAGESCREIAKTYRVHHSPWRDCSPAHKVPDGNLYRQWRLKAEIVRARGPGSSLQ